MVAVAQSFFRTTAEPLVIVRAHPQGGWTHAWLEQPGTSSCRVYRGWWATQAAAEAALRRLNHN